ncbi:AAA family ATPase [Scleromatobacter humisilvae]|uniref:MoxR family ATPase n=1 Tax=Scleromatobacter humisilvae TaxID=2897159 RepID=A0A9X2C3Z0_9BURK|nr:MoxR family ATPase [Scleromatobacter humisilvae]MCK9688280.1 MoxR family ATPase [Scleromatobacter humisilvae]
MAIDSKELEFIVAALGKLRTEVGRAVVGQQEVIDQTLIAFVASGHILYEGLPGLGKTLLARALAQAMSLQFSRVQFTPDLMPSDLTGHAVLEPGTDGGIGRLRLRKGPVFTNLLLGDEINRAPAKTQSALLEVMQERQVTLEGQTVSLPRPFMVLATQNPIDSEGTYPLPEAQRDRFLFKIDIGFPTQSEEVDVVKAATGHQVGDALPLDKVQRCLTEADVSRLQQCVSSVLIDDRVVDYAVRLTRATRGAVGLGNGAGSRGAIALVRAARAAALIAGRDYATPDDVKRQVLPALRHRVVLSPDAQLEGRAVDDVLREIATRVDAPRL